MLQRKRPKIFLSNEDTQPNAVLDCYNDEAKHDLSLLCSTASSSSTSLESATKRDNMERSQMIIAPPPEYATSSDSYTTHPPTEITSNPNSYLPRNWEKKYLASEYKPKTFNFISRDSFSSEPQPLPTNRCKTLSDLPSQIIAYEKASHYPDSAGKSISDADYLSNFEPPMFTI